MRRHLNNRLSSLIQTLTLARERFREELQELRNPAHPAGSLAAAFALGTLLSFIPIPIMDSLLVGILLTRFKQLNRASLFIARLIWNDFLIFPLYGPGYRLGSAVIGPTMSAQYQVPGVGTAVTPLLSFITGTFILAISVTLFAYCTFLLGICLYRSFSLPFPSSQQPLSQ